MTIDLALDRFIPKRLLEIVRFYQAAAVNAAFGFGSYAALIALGMNLYAAQLLAHCMGVAFNYFSYSRYVFRDSAPAKVRFVVTYAVSYVLSVAFLWLASLMIASPYLAGFVAMVGVSLVNYVVLKFAVFRKPAT
jgi:putative flippase GtrA